MSNYKCKSCHCKCHCDNGLHTHHWDNDVCTCEQCNCEKSKAEELTYESNGGLVIDSTDDCESCQ